MKKIKKIVAITLAILFIFTISNVIYAKYRITKELAFTVTSSKFYFDATKSIDTIVFSRTANANDHEDILTTLKSFNIVIKNNDGTNFNAFDVNYEVSIVDNDKFTFEEGDKITGTISGGAKKDLNLTLNLKIKNLENPKKTVRILVTSTSPYKKSIELQFNVQQDGAIQTIEDLLDLSLSVRGLGKTRVVVTSERFKMTRDLDFKDPNSYDDAYRQDYGDVNGDEITEDDLLDEMTKHYEGAGVTHPGAGFLPIGINDAGSTVYEFAGTFNGGNHTLSNLRLHKAKQTNIGLFGYTHNADIRNLIIKNGDVYNENQTAGMLIGKAEGGTISNVTVEGTSVTSVDTIHTTQDTYAGGVIGVIEGGTISNCINYATVLTRFSGEATQYSGPAGGIVAWMKDATIENCVNYGLVTGQKFIGGIAGFAAINGDGTVMGCENHGNVGTYITNNSTGPGQSVGGICGYNGPTGVVDDCTNYADASISGMSNIGGIVGRNLGTIKNCDNYSKNITGIYGNVGPIAGQNSGNISQGNVNH